MKRYTSNFTLTATIANEFNNSSIYQNVTVSMIYKLNYMYVFNLMTKITIN